MSKTYHGAAETPGKDEYDAIDPPGECPVCGSDLVSAITDGGTPRAASREAERQIKARQLSGHATVVAGCALTSSETFRRLARSERDIDESEREIDDAKVARELRDAGRSIGDALEHVADKLIEDALRDADDQTDAGGEAA